MTDFPDIRRIAIAPWSVALLASVALSACSALGASGPSHASIRHLNQASPAPQKVTLIHLDNDATTRLNSLEKSRSFATVLGDSAVQDPLLGAGDVLDITVWEAPPAVLFGAAGDAATAGLGAQNRTVIQQVVGTDGNLSIPFAGNVVAAGRTTAQIEHEIVKRLRGRANDPQVTVRLAENDSRNVTVLGEVVGSRRVPIGPRGERLLDAIASAGGARQPVAQTMIQFSRGDVTANMMLEKVIRDPRQNVRVKPGDVITLLHQPYTFIALGAVVKSAEIPFEGGGFTLAQALGRMGGLRDDRANIRGVFVFRLENALAVEPTDRGIVKPMANGRIPVVYQLDMSDPTALFLAQEFSLNDKDVLYVSTAPGADLARFLSTIAGISFSAISIGNILK